jgi:hypothetical protein
MRSEQIACCAPDLVVVDVDAQPERIHELLTGLRGESATMQLPIVLTGRQRQRLRDLTAELGGSDQPATVSAPLTADLGELLTAIEAFAAEPLALQAT